MALLIGYGAGAINPYLAFESIEDLIAATAAMASTAWAGSIPHKAVKNYIKACGKGVLKVMSKMGVSTVASYTGAQIFEAIGLGDELVDRYFTGTVSRLGGIGLDEIAGRGGRPPRHRPPDAGPRSVPTASSSSAASTSGAARASTTCSTRRRCSSCSTPRGPSATTSSRSTPTPSTTSRSGWPRCAACSSSSSANVDPVPIEEVEPVSDDRAALLDRGDELRLDLDGGARDAGDRDEPASAASRTPARVARTPSGCTTRSGARPIKQVASGRFGVTAEYLTNADDLQIKMAQGAKPGEGGQLPGHKVYPWIAKTRYSTPGVGSDQPAAAPRHLLDRGPQAADPRPEERQPGGAGARQAGRRDRRRHGGRRREQGQGRRRAHLRARRRHRRQPADVAEARRRAVGARPRRDPADAAAQRPARPHRGADRRPDEDRPRRRDRRPARRRGVRLRHRTAGGVGLRDDARLPPRHVPGRRRHAEPRAARPLQRASPSSSSPSSSSSPRRCAS